MTMATRTMVTYQQSILYDIVGNYRDGLIADFKFHNAGQGLFFSGKIADFNFVYDCGSTKRNHINSVVTSYKKDNPARLDLLVLSHLHDDHIAGLNTLFKRPRTSVDTVVLPYLPPIERLMVALTNIGLEPWFYRFWSDPVRFLVKNGVKRILLLGGSKASAPADGSRPEITSENEEKLDITEMPDDELLHDEVIRKDSQWKTLLTQGRLLTRSHDGHICLKAKQRIWSFRFFNCRVEDSKISQFETNVKRITKSGGLISTIRNTSKLRQLKGCYRKLHKDFNNTSIVLYHAPITSMHDKTEQQNGLLLTGDVDLNQKWLEIRKHFGSEIKNVFLCLVSHHGARSNWNKAILTVVPKECLWVVSSGISNKFGHPSWAVIRDVIRNGSQLIWTNETTELSTIALL